MTANEILANVGSRIPGKQSVSTLLVLDQIFSDLQQLWVKLV